VKLVSAVAIIAALAGCATPDRPYVQLPIELRVIHVESSRANIPVTQFTGPLPGQVETKAIPGMMEAIAVIAQAVSDCFKWGFQSAASQARNANQHGFISVDVVSIRWGSPKEPEQSAQMWDMYSKFLDKLPTEIPMYHPNVEDFARAMQAFQGWRDEPRGK
jgi:hypothetical protein